MEETPHDVRLLREFAGMDNWNLRLPDERTMQHFRHLIEKRRLATQMLTEMLRCMRSA